MEALLAGDSRRASARALRARRPRRCSRCWPSAMRSSGAAPHLKLALARTDLLADARRSPSTSSSAADLAEIEAFYRAAYPGTWFAPRMLATGRYVGSGRTAGSSAWQACTSTPRRGAWPRSATWRRCRSAVGKASRAVRAPRSACCCSADGIETIALNVRADNAAAIAAYTRLGLRAGRGVRRGEPPHECRRDGEPARSTQAEPASAAGQRCPKWCARGRAAPTSSSATRRASAAEGLDRADEDVPVLPHPLVAAVREEQRLVADDRPMLLVHVLRDDQVHLAVLVLEQHEHDPVRRGRPLPRDREARVGHGRSVRRTVQLVTRERPRGQVRPQQQQRMDADRQPREAVVGRHPLPAREIPQLGSGGGRDRARA